MKKKIIILHKTLTRYTCMYVKISHYYALITGLYSDLTFRVKVCGMSCNIQSNSELHLTTLPFFML